MNTDLKVDSFQMLFIDAFWTSTRIFTELIFLQYSNSTQQLVDFLWGLEVIKNANNVNFTSKPYSAERVGGGGISWRCTFVCLWRACNLTAFTPCLTGPVDYPFASRHKGPGFKTPGGYLCETGILLLALSRYMLLVSHPRLSPPLPPHPLLRPHLCTG